MTIEASVPLSEVKSALKNYSRLYNAISNATSAFIYKKNLARNTISSLLFTIVKIFLLFYCGDILFHHRASGIVWLVCGIVFFFCFITVFFDFFYIQRIEVNGKIKRRPRFRPIYFIKAFIGDIVEIEFFKKKFNIKTPAFLLIFGVGNQAVYSKLIDWAFDVMHSHVVAINQYEKKYSDYRDYVDLWQHFSLCGELLQIINSGRASDIQGALSVVDVRRHRSRMENMMRQQTEAIKSAAADVSEAARAAKDFFRRN